MSGIPELKETQIIYHAGGGAPSIAKRQMKSAAVSGVDLQASGLVCCSFSVPARVRGIEGCLKLAAELAQSAEIPQSEILAGGCFLYDAGEGETGCGLRNIVCVFRGTAGRAAVLGAVEIGVWRYLPLPPVMRIFNAGARLMGCGMMPRGLARKAVDARSEAAGEQAIISVSAAAQELPAAVAGIETAGFWRWGLPGAEKSAARLLFERLKQAGAGVGWLECADNAHDCDNICLFTDALPEGIDFMRRNIDSAHIAASLARARELSVPLIPAAAEYALETALPLICAHIADRFDRAILLRSAFTARLIYLEQLSR